MKMRVFEFTDQIDFSVPAIKLTWTQSFVARRNFYFALQTLAGRSRSGPLGDSFAFSMYLVKF